ncbi:MAG: branched-chain amino acid transport system ATP-binding protein [Roseibaca calidilacus]|uniref:Amino acid/amide ABC transporter ATP-binding protein 2, HAAT family n=1 Tax=Roseibaca calidilacus TaxID=1666912 RepID=A0A0P7WS93_9RHOB|nr:ABC transporter ATP-binding protein [Roseibaca calidilacus]KPP90095.1 MAG: branched-chain amino acid transport system ATP-binding protein [Roseibaca calidilacus]CUX81236.1 amino acid/amide ABC transporter ATP-binding protein 2, HAAT family [Roseibaca calidilacus]
MTLLRVENLTARYGASQALFGVDFTLAEGEVLALMGRNGMGKTTTVKAICRMIPSQGRLEFSGQNLHVLPSFRAARLGLGLVPEGRRCFASLSVAENLIAAARPGHWTLERVTRFLPRLGERLGQRAASLSGGEQQMLAIGRALMTNPRLLILDEATEGLAPLIRAEIWGTIAALKRDSGMSILVIDKTLSELAQVADSAAIIARGKTVWSGAMEDLSADVTEQYVGV